MIIILVLKFINAPGEIGQHKGLKSFQLFYLQKRYHKAAVNGPWDVEHIFLAASEVLNKTLD